MTNNCISCGCEIPEGMQVCKACEAMNTGAKSAWVSVNDRLPKTGAEVIVCAETGVGEQRVAVGYCSGIRDKWFHPTACGLFGVSGVTHWMPLPEPPKEE